METFDAVARHVTPLSAIAITHVLRRLLRAIAGFSGLLRDRHYETIDADGRRCIDRVLAHKLGMSQRMSKVIDDLLELGRVTLSEYRKSRCGTARQPRQNERERTFFVQDNGIGFGQRGATIYFTLAKGQQ